MSAGLDYLDNMFKDMESRRISDAKKFAESDKDLCMCCHAYGEDKRSLWIDCFYAVNEVIPEAIELSTHIDPQPENHTRGYYLRICKNCRARLLGMLGTWWQEGVARRELEKDHDGNVEETDPDRNIAVRENGIVKMITREEWDERERKRNLPEF